MRNLLKEKKGVFGLNAVQSFFAIILGIALLAYVIVIIMGTLSTANIVGTNTLAYNQTQYILANVSNGVTGFFSSINPVYAILAVLVIILVLVVLVRVVQSPGSSGTPTL
jgi:thiosulfate reductase cytochrome b subunit